MDELSRLISQYQMNNGDAFLLTSRTIIAVGQSLQSLPAIAVFGKEIIHGLCHPDSEEFVRHYNAIESLFAWIWDGSTARTVSGGNSVIPIAIALDAVASKPYN